MGLCQGNCEGRIHREVTTGLNMSCYFLNSRNRDTDLENGCVDTERGLMVGDDSGGWDGCMRTARR